MAQRSRRFTIRLNDEEWQKLEAYAKSRNISMSECVREWIETRVVVINTSDSAFDERMKAHEEWYEQHMKEMNKLLEISREQAKYVDELTKSGNEIWDNFEKKWAILRKAFGIDTEE